MEAVRFYDVASDHSAMAKVSDRLAKFFKKSGESFIQFLVLTVSI